jgi:hypothetical protein
MGEEVLEKRFWRRGFGEERREGAHTPHETNTQRMIEVGGFLAATLSSTKAHVKSSLK